MGLYFNPKKIFPPPSENNIFFPSHDTPFFYSHRGLFALILPYFAFILPFYLPFSHFLSPFVHFLLHFPPFSLHLLIFFPPIDIGWYFSPPRWEGYFLIHIKAPVFCKEDGEIIEERCKCRLHKMLPLLLRTFFRVSRKKRVAVIKKNHPEKLEDPDSSDDNILRRRHVGFLSIIYL